MMLWFFFSRYLQLIRSRHHQEMLPTTNTHASKYQCQVFALDQLEEDLVLTYIVGKPLIESPSLLREVFKFNGEDVSQE